MWYVLVIFGHHIWQGQPYVWKIKLPSFNTQSWCSLDHLFLQWLLLTFYLFMADMFRQRKKSHTLYDSRQYISKPINTFQAVVPHETVAISSLLCAFPCTFSFLVFNAGFLSWWLFLLHFWFLMFRRHLAMAGKLAVPAVVCLCLISNTLYCTMNISVHGNSLFTCEVRNQISVYRHQLSVPILFAFIVNGLWSVWCGFRTFPGLYSRQIDQCNIMKCACLCKDLLKGFKWSRSHEQTASKAVMWEGVDCLADHGLVLVNCFNGTDMQSAVL